MQINLTGQHIDVTEALRKYVETKLSKLERHFDHVTKAHVVLSVEKVRQRAEATVHAAGANLFADAVHEDMYAAIDAMSDKLDRQIVKHKEKLTDHHRDRTSVRGHAATDPDAPTEELTPAALRPDQRPALGRGRGGG